jgi:thiol-disulfide isomerase/thioredoxin
MASSRALLRVSLAVCGCLLAAADGASAAGIAGLWDAVVVANKVEVPFRFEIVQKGNLVEGFFFEGDRKVGSTSGTFENGVLRLEYDHLNTTLEATIDGDRLRGTYGNRLARAKPMEFRAERPGPITSATTTAPRVDGNWMMYRTAKDNSKLDVSWRLYLRQSGSDVSGAILRTSGDSGTLVGRWRDGQLVLSHFAGERPLLFEAKLNADGSLAVTLDRQFTYLAARSAEAKSKNIPEPPDLTRFTSMKDPSARFHFAGANLEGQRVSDSDARFEGKVVVVTIGGSWCPNCHDEAPFLVELYKEFHARGLEIVGLFFENDADLTVVRPRVLAFIKRYAVPFPILVPGTVDQAAAKLPQLDNLAVYPTTLILGRDGRVRQVRAGFASAATGEEHLRLKREKRELIKRLLEEKPSTTRQPFGPQQP